MTETIVNLEFKIPNMLDTTDISQSQNNGNTDDMTKSHRSDKGGNTQGKPRHFWTYFGLFNPESQQNSH
jgi:hypothetical protein